MLQKSIKCPYFLLFYPKLFFWLCFLSFCIHVKDIFLKLSSQLHLPTHTSFFLSIFTACMIEIAVQLINCAIEANSHKLFDPAQSGPQPSLQRNGQSENRSHSLTRHPRGFACSSAPWERVPGSPCGEPAECEPGGNAHGSHTCGRLKNIGCIMAASKCLSALITDTDWHTDLTGRTQPAVPS